MDRATYQRAMEIFEAALEAPEPQAVVEALCQGDEALRGFVLSMLEADQAEELVVDRTADQGLGAVLARDMSQDEEALPERIGAYRVLERIGAGGMGVVYAAEEQHPRRIVAIKCLHHWLASEVQRQQFRVEAQAMGQLQHPHIPRVLAAGEAEGRPYLVMERVEGVSLTAWVRATSPSLEARARLLVAVARAVAHAHQQGVLHRDLKPGNVLVDAQDQPHVLDFGLASLVESTSELYLAGTPQYMSPGSRRGEPADERSDVWSLGQVGAELFEGAPGSAWLRRDLEAVVARATAEEPAERYPSAADLAEDLERAVASRPVSARPQTPAYRMGAALRRHRRELGAALVALAAVVTLLLGGWAVLQVLEHRAAQAREAVADQRLEAAWARMEALGAQGLSEDVDATFHAFVDHPDHRGTRALSRAWAERAASLVGSGQDEEELAAWATAYETAPDDPLRDQALVGLARTFRDRWDWEGLGAVLALWQGSRGVPPEAADLVREALVLGRRPGTRDPAWSRLGQGHPLEPRLSSWWRRDVDGDGVDEVVRCHTGRHELQVLSPSLQPLRTLGLPDLGAPLTHLFPLDGGLVLALVQQPGQRTAHLLQEVDGGLVERWSHPDLYTAAALAADLDGDGHHEVYLAANAGGRGLLRLEEEDGVWRASRPHPQTDAVDSDLTSLVLLEGEEGPVLLAGVGPWRAYELRAYRPEAQGLVLVDSLRLGVIRGVVPFRGSGGEPLLAVTTSREMRNPALFGEDYPEPVGLHLVRWDGTSLEEVRHVPLPESSAHPPPLGWWIQDAGDVDGDGLEDLLLSTFRDGSSLMLLLRQQASGELQPTLLGGLRPWLALDVDGDGVEEVLAREQEEDRDWILGQGDQALSAWTELGALEVSAPAGQAWRPCAELASMGLRSEGAACVETRVSSPLLDQEVEGLRWAARLRSAGQQDEEALRDWEALLRVEPADAEALLARARIQTRSHDYASALSAWEALPSTEEARSALAWLRPQLAPLQEIDRHFHQALGGGWQVEDPVAARVLRSRGTLRLQTFSDGTPVASLPLVRTGPRVELEVELEITRAEEASAISFELRGPSGEKIGIKIGFGAGGGVSGRHLSCYQAPGVLIAERNEPVDLYTYSELLHLSLVHVPDTAETRCTVRDAGGEVLLQGSQQVPPSPLSGEMVLEIEGSGHTRYLSPMRLVAEVDHLAIRGAEPVAREPSPLLALVDGEPEEALRRLPPAALVARGVALHELGRTQEAAALLASAPDGPHLLHVVRTTDAALAEHLLASMGPRYLELFGQAWAGSVHHWANGAAAEALLEAPFRDLPGRTRAQRRLLAWQARAAWDDGQETRARVAVERVLSLGDEDDGEIRADALLLAAIMAQADGDEARAARLARELVAASPVELVARDRLRLSGLEVGAQAGHEPGPGQAPVPADGAR